MISYTSSSAQVVQVIETLHSRRLLLHTPLYHPPGTAAPPVAGNSQNSPDNYTGKNSLDENVVMVLSVLLCALICSLGLNSIIKCALRCSSFVGSESGESPSARLANTGVKRKALKTFPTLIYSAGLKLPGLDTECVICLSEFTSGERLRVLPKCNHGFHVRCIDKWLTSHSSCPTCRHCLIDTCQKIIGCGQTTSSAPVPPPPPPPPPPPLESQTIVTILPLEPEGLIRNYRATS